MYRKWIASFDRLFFLTLVSVPTVLLLHKVGLWVNSVFSAPLFG
jgi:hypothetical protein